MPANFGADQKVALSRPSLAAATHCTANRRANEGTMATRRPDLDRPPHWRSVNGDGSLLWPQKVPQSRGEGRVAKLYGLARCGPARYDVNQGEGPPPSPMFFDIPCPQKIGSPF